MNENAEDHSLQILLVEDNPTDALLIEDALEEVRNVEITLTHVKRLDEALARLKAEYFDAVLLDLGLPDSTGLETFTRTQSQYPKVPILILSGLDDETLALTAVRDGAQEYLVKGKLDSIMLARTIRYAIERKRTEQKLMDSEESYRRLFETTQDGIFILNADSGQITDANPALETLLGYTRSDLIGKRLWEIAPFRDKAANQAAFATLQEKGAIRYEDLPLATKSGQFIDVEFVSNVHTVGSHQLIQCNIRDISERKSAEAIKRESQHFLQSTLDSLSSHVAVLDENGNVVTVNQAWRRFYEENDGMAATCGVGANYLEACAGASGLWSDGAQEVLSGVRSVMAGVLPQFHLEYPCHNPSTQRWFNVRITRFEGGGPTRVVVSHENITERKLAEMALQKNETKFRTIFETALDAILLANDDGHYIDANPAACALLGLAHQQLMGRSIADFVSPSTQDAVRAAWHEFLREGQQSGEFEFRRPDGTDRQAEFRAVAGLLPGVHMSMLRDVTERKQAETTLLQSEARFRTAISEAPVPIIIHREDGKVLLISKGWTEYSGYSLDDIPTIHDWAARAYGSSATQAQQHIEDLHHIKEARDEGEWTVAAKNGEMRIWDFRSTPLGTFGDGRHVVISVAQDITNRRQAEADLRASEERFQSIVANVPGVVYQYILHPDGSVEIPFVNEACRDLLEMEPEEIQRHPNFPTEIIHPDDRAQSERSVIESATNLTPWKWEGRFQLPSGETKWVQGAAHPRRLPDGGTFWDGLLMDITARKEAEAERDRFFTMSLDMLAIADHNGYFKRLNPAFEKTLGHSNAELMAKPFLEWVHPDDRAATLEVMKQLDAGASALNFANRYLCRDGSYRWLSWVLAPFENLIYAAAHDITSLKNAEAALHKANDELELHVMERTAELGLTNEQLQLEIIERRRADESLYKNHEFLQAVLENTTEGIVACDAKGQLAFFNRATREFHGLPLESLPVEQWSQHYSLYLPDGVTPMQMEDVPLFRALSGDHVRDIEMVIAPRDGSTRLVINNGEPLFDNTGEKLGAVVVMHDITSRKQAEETLRVEVIEREMAIRALSEAYEIVQRTNEEAEQARQEAERANLAKSEFLSRMSHELRTPLNAILGFGQILAMRSKESTPQQQDHIQQILKAGRHLLDLINEVLDIARIEAGHLSLSPEPTAVGVLVREALDMAQPLALTRRIELVSEMAEEHSAQYVLADQQRLRQVLLNLLSNAVKYNREDGRIVVSCEILDGEPIIYNGTQCAGQLRLMVRDTGLGLPPEDIARLFVPFERLGASQTQIEGSGIGLSICKPLIEAMHGRIGVESQVGEGSTFWLELPIANAPQKKSTPALQDSSEMPPAILPGTPVFDGTRTILYIEDNLSNISLIQHVLTDFNGQIRLLTAMQGSLGLELAALHRPDLILLDVNLPDIMGDEVLARLKANPATADIPIVALSADATPRQIERMLTAGATYYLTKPLDIEQFFEVLEQTFNRKSPAEKKS